MRDFETTNASKFEALQLPIANMPDVYWHLNFAELMEQFRRLGARALKRNPCPSLARMPTATIREIQRGPVPRGSGEAGLLRLQASVHEFAAFAVANSRGHSLMDCALLQSDALPGEVQAYLPALAASAWELYEVVGLPSPGAPHRVELRRLCDEAFVEVTALESDSSPQIGEIAAWRVFDAGGFLAAPRALQLPKDSVATILSQLSLEASGWGNQPQARRDYMRERGELLLINHCIRSMRHRHCETREPAPSRKVDALVSPSESDLPSDCWRRLAQAFSVLEVSAASRPGVAFPFPFAVGDGQVLCLEEAGESWVATLFDSARAHKQWSAVQQSLARTTHTKDAAGRPLRAVPQLRCWRARAEELSDLDIDFLRSLRLKPLRNGAALAVHLDADWRWHDLDPRRIDRLIDALHVASKQLRTGEGLAA